MTPLECLADQLAYAVKQFNGKTTITRHDIDVLDAAIKKLSKLEREKRLSTIA